MSFEAAGCANQIIQNAYGLVLNMRDNANGYIAQANAVAAGTAPANMTYASIAAVMVADANLYLKRIGWMTTLAQNNAAAFSAALAVYGMVTADATALRNTLTTVCNHTLAASLTDQASITAEANFILANVPNFSRVF